MLNVRVILQSPIIKNNKLGSPTDEHLMNT